MMRTPNPIRSLGPVKFAAAAVWTGSLLALAAALAAAPVSAQEFTLITDPANPIVNDTEPVGSKYYGSSWVDYDNDGDLDLYINQTYLYRNDGGGAFTKVTDSGLGSAQQDGGGTFDAAGNTWADYDNDGDLDAFLAGRVSHLYRNEGDGTFTQIVDGEISDGLANRGWTAAWGDIDLDGWVDLVITHPAGFVANGDPLPNHLFRNGGPPDFAFTRIEAPGITDSLDAYTVATWSDPDADGDLDLWIGSGPANGTYQPDNLFRNLLAETGSAAFERITESPIGTDLQDGQVWNWIDHDNDGDLDAYVTNWGGQAGGYVNRLYRQESDGSFTSVTDDPISSDPDVALASVWGDFDNDGDLDAYVGTDGFRADLYYRNNGDGTFTRVEDSPLAAHAEPHRSASAGDYDNDGDLDLFLNGPAGRRKLFRNDTQNGNHWLNLTLIGTASNRAAIGAKVRARAVIGGIPVWQTREVSAQNSFNAHNSLRVHFGLGDAVVVDSLRIEWPGGAVDDLVAVAADQFLVVTEGGGVSEASDPRPDFLAGGVAGLRVAAAPDPSSSSVSLSFALPEPGDVSLAVFDSTGRLVRSILDGAALAAGTQSVEWDGRDRFGRVVPQGAYWCRIDAGGVEWSGRITRVR